MVRIPLSHFLFYGFYQSLTYKRVMRDGVRTILFSLMNHYGLVWFKDISYLCQLKCVTPRRHPDNNNLKMTDYEQSIPSETQAHQTIERHNPHPRNGGDSNNPAAHHHSILQWSQGGAGGIHAPLCFRLQEGVLQPE